MGRETERAELAGLVDRAAHGHGSLVLIGGEPGVGKTRLTEELGSEAAAKGFRVLVGRCYEIDGAPPYVPFVEIFEQALAAAPEPRDVAGPSRRRRAGSRQVAARAAPSVP